MRSAVRMAVSEPQTSPLTRVWASAMAAMLLFSPLQDVTLLPGPLRGVAQAKELASGSGSRVNKDPESLLRLGLPSQPADLRAIQLKLEEGNDSLQRFLTVNAASAVNTAKGTLKGKSGAILKAVPKESADLGKEYYASIESSTSDALQAITSNNPSGAQKSLADALSVTTKLEELIATGYVQPAPPAEFANLPYLKGRATVEFELKRPGGSFDVDGNLYKTLKITSIVDGYTAPLTAGNFVDLVSKGFYDGMKVQRSDGFVVQQGDPAAEGGKGAEKNGYVAPGTSEVCQPPDDLASGDLR